MELHVCICQMNGETFKKRGGVVLIIVDFQTSIKCRKIVNLKYAFYSLLSITQLSLYQETIAKIPNEASY